MTANKYVQIGKINLLNYLAYWSDFLLRTVFILVILFIFYHLWTAVYTGNQAIAGFTVVMIVWYLLFSESIVTNQPYIHEDIGDDVRTGQLAYYLNKPYNYLLYHLAQSFAKWLIGFAIMMAVGSVLLLLFVGWISVPLEAFPIIFLCACLAFVIDFMFTFLIGLLAFWLEDTTAVHWVYHKIVFMIGGMLLPLEVFPDWVANISRYLPFSFIAYHPAKLFVDFSWGAVVNVLLGQVIYIALFAGIAATLYGFAVSRLNINGG